MSTYLIFSLSNCKYIYFFIKIFKQNRNVEALVVHSPVILKDKDFFDEEYDLYDYGKMSGLFVENTWNAKICDECKPESEDIILQNRTNFDAFEGTGLDSIMTKNKIRRVFIMGFLSNACVEETARSFSTKLPDIEIFVLSDGTAAETIDDHANAVDNVLSLFSECITCDQAMEKLSAKATPKPIYRFQQATERPAGYRPRILALCGAKSNNEVTRLQLENLRITDEAHDIVYLQGNIEVEEGDPALAGLVLGSPSSTSIFP